MKNIRTILVVAGLLYTIITIILMMNEDALYNEINWIDLMSYYKYWMILGLVLLVSIIIVGSLKIRQQQKQYSQLEQEHAAVKAHLYDVEQKRIAEDEEAGKRIEAFRNSLGKTNRPADPGAPQS